MEPTTNTVATRAEPLPAFATLRRDYWRSFGAAGRLRKLGRFASLSIVGAMHNPPATRFLRCLFCHTVFDDEIDAFREMIAYLQQLGKFVSTGEAVAMARGDRPIDANYFHLSFDDGFENNFVNAAPVLAQRRVPALFFLVSRFIGASDADVVKHWFDPSQIHRPVRPMSWAQARELLAQGHDLGAHTQTHPRLSDLTGDAERQRREIVDCKAEIEAGAGAECRWFSYPYGAMGEQTREFAAQAGYAACFTGVRGQVQPGRTDLLRIPRHQLEPGWPRLHIRYFATGGRERD